MPVYEIETPDGRRFEVDAPDQQAATNAAMQQARSNPLQGQGDLWPIAWDVDPETNQRVNRRFDPGAGLLGALTGAATLPGDVVTGRADVGPIGSPRQASDDVIGRTLEAAAVLSPATAAARQAPIAVRSPKIPTGRELREAGAKGFEQSQKMGVKYNPRALSELGDRLEVDFNAQGIFREDAPQTYAALDLLKSGRSLDPTDRAVSVDASSFASLKRRLRQARKPTATVRPTESEVTGANALIRALDRFVEDPDPASVMAGPASEAGRIQQLARQNYAAGKRSGQITGKLDSAELRAIVANSGQNVDNQIRSRAAWFVDPERPERLFGFSKAEADKIREVAKGTATRNTLRYVGNLFGGGGGLGQFVVTGFGGGAGAAAGGVPGAAVGAMIPPAIGMAAKGMGNVGTRRAMQNADELIRMRSPMGQQALRNVPTLNPSMGFRAAPSRFGTAATLNQPDQDVIEALLEEAKRRGLR